MRIITRKEFNELLVEKKIDFECFMGGSKIEGSIYHVVEAGGKYYLFDKGEEVILEVETEMLNDAQKYNEVNGI